MSRRQHNIEKDEKTFEPVEEKKPLWLIQRERRIENLARARDIKNGKIPRPVQPQESKEEAEKKRIEKIERELEAYKKRYRNLKLARKKKQMYKKRAEKIKALETNKRQGNVLYSVTYKVNYIVDGKHKTYQVEGYETFMKQPTLSAAVKADLVQRAFLELTNKAHNYDVNISSISIVEKRGEKPVFVRVTKPKKFLEVELEGFQFSYEFFGQDTMIKDKICWYAFLLENGIKDDVIKEHFKQTTQAVTVGELAEFLKKCKRSYRFCDLTANAPVTYVEQDKARHDSAVYGVVTNGHIYTVKNKEARHAISKRFNNGTRASENVQTKIVGGISPAKKPPKKEDKRPHKDMPANILDLDLYNDDSVYYNHGYDNDENNKEELYNIMCQIMLVHKTVPKRVRVVAGTYMSMNWKNITFYYNPHAKKCIEICKILKLQYKNQTIQMLSREVLDRLKINRMALMSRSNADVRGLFNSDSRGIYDNKHVKCGGMVYRPETVQLQNKSIVSYDITRCYSYIISTYTLPVFSIWDEVLPYKGNTIFSQAFYFVEKRNMLMQGHGFYIGYLVQYCLDEKLIAKSDIKYVLKPSNTTDCLRKFVRGVHEMKLGAYAKNIVNMAIGALAIKDSKCTQTVFTTNAVDACYYRTLFNAKISSSEVNENLTLYRVDQTVHSIASETGKPAYAAIVQLGYMLVHKLWKSIYKIDNDAKLLCIQVDCVVAEVKPEFNDKIKKDIVNCLTKQRSTDKIGFIRPNKVPEAITQNKVVYHDSVYEYRQNQNWEDTTLVKWTFDEAKALCAGFSSCYITGAAGDGKSYMLQAFLAQLKTRYADDEICICGFTNTCMSGDVEGKTMHSVFSAKVGANELDVTELRKQSITKIKACLVDELSMVPGHFYSYLLLMKQLGVKMYLFGQFAQMPPVGETIVRDYENATVLKQLADYNRIQLTYSYRYSQEYRAMLLKGTIPLEYFERNGVQSNEIDKLNIAKYRNVCEDINNICAALYGQKGENGSRILVNFNLHSLGVCNGQIYEIIDKDLHKVKQIGWGDKPIKTISNWPLLMASSELGYCITVHKSQGMTFKEKHTIYTYDHFETKNLKYTALSRTSDPNLVRIDNKRVGTIYKISKVGATANDPIYIGSASRGMQRRFEEHVEESKTSTNSKLNKYLRENACVVERVRFVLYSKREELLRLEDKYIKLLDTVNKGLNSRVNFAE